MSSKIFALLGVHSQLSPVNYPQKIFSTLGMRVHPLTTPMYTGSQIWAFDWHRRWMTLKGVVAVISPNSVALSSPWLKWDPVCYINV